MGRNWAIAIGINGYENLSSLKYAKRDAEAMAAWFEQEAKFDEVFLFTEDSPPIAQTNPPIPTTPTYGHLRRFLRAQFENLKRPLLKPEDNLWFFFAGHGMRSRDKDYLMLSDSDPGDVEYTAISVEYVTQRLRRSGADNVVLFLDACRDEGSRGGLGIGNEKHQGVITFYSCTANQKSWEVDELQQGSFTHTLLAGLRLQRETNCATVERLNQYLLNQVPKLNTRYGKPQQNPYLKAEPPYKINFILLEQSATLKDVEPLKYQASLAENEGNLLLAEQLWIRILAVSRGDLDAIAAIKRIAVKNSTRPQDAPQESVSSTPESATLPRGEGVEASETEIQREEQHQQNLEQYRRSFSQAVEQEFPLNEPSLRKLRNLQQSLQLTDEEVLQIQQPIITQKEAEERQRREAERIRQQKEAERVQRQRARSHASYFTEDLGNSINLEMIAIPGGTFMMGSPEGEGGDSEKPQHEVTVQAFYMGKYPITQAQYQQIMGNNPSKFKGDERPVECVSWNDAVEFCQRLSGQTGKEYRLPSEAEWEYACRAGTTTKYYFGDDITSDLANYDGNVGETTSVGQYSPNAFGLYDMHGNVWEWCQDKWHDNYQDAPNDGRAWVSGDISIFVLRGGSWDGFPRYCRSAYRGRDVPDDTVNDLGFRVACGGART